ncbi:MAG TPA: nitroreductase [Allosphingosinicella sp.]|nr:nitroreductase [Allosphingosinicella sp.]
MFAESRLSARPWLTAPLVDETIASRRAIRRYLPQTVPVRAVHDILEIARHAPSASNIQPWRCHVLTGAARDRLVAEALAAFRADGPRALSSEYEFYPAELPEAFQGRRAAFGAKLGGALGIAQADIAARLHVMARNFMFFEAPVGIIFTIDRRLERASLLDYGCFLQNVMFAARARGLDTCPQQTWAMMHRVIRPVLGLGEEEMVVCGMAMGFADPEAPENMLGLAKEAPARFAAFYEELADEEELLCVAA